MTRNTDISAATRRVVMDRDESACVICAGVTGLQVHHRRPRGMGGTHRPETNTPPNLVVLCAEHHARVESHRAWALTHGLLVRQHADPATVPVNTIRGTLRLHPDGGFTIITKERA